MSSTISFQRPDGKTVSGYLSQAERADAPAIVVIQEWWGLNDQIRGVADRLAHAGFTALVPDLYRGQSTTVKEEAHHLMTALDFGDAASQDIRGAVQHLAQGGTPVGCMGFCMGGALTLLAACQAPELAAAVVWYGCPPVEYVDASKIRMPLQCHWATQDAFFPLAQVEALEAKLKAADVDVDVDSHRYLAHHAFANEEAVGDGRIAETQYDRVWAERAWDRTFAFLGRKLVVAL